jgi:GNAT superfamily N-acetyltransferase
VTLAIRRAVVEDVPVILRLVRALAEYEREPDAVLATEADFARDGFGAEPRFHVLLATWDGEPVGFAFYFFTYSTWRGSPCLYLEDLFVLPAHRGKKIGMDLMKRLAKEAVARRCGRFLWAVLDWNEPAIRFYQSLGATLKREWLTVWLTDDALRALAK